MAFTKVVSLALLLAPASAVIPGHRVDELPGWKGPLFSATYSGLISAGEEDGYTMREHYLFFESEGNPKTDPVLVWTNGGPGAASLFGAFTELGPYYLSAKSVTTDDYKATGVPSLFENDFRWTKLGSLLIINSPPPVGFSYCDPAGPSGGGTSCGSWNDTKTAKHTLEFLMNWSDKFPEFAHQDLYIIGESYAGVYVPTLVREILNKGSARPSSQLKGFAVGDACLGGTSDACVPWTGPRFNLEFFYGHGQISSKTYQAIQASCSSQELLEGPRKGSQCEADVSKANAEQGYSFAYNLYDECYDFGLSKRRLHQSSYEPHHMDGFPCGGSTVLSAYTNSTKVRRALHVAEDSYFFDADNGHGFVYNQTEPNLIPFYKHVVQATNLRVLVYNGDADPALNTFFGQYWTSQVSNEEIESWRPWTLDGKNRMGGFVTRYKGDFDYLTIRGAGHMVPEYKPAASLVFLGAWLKNEDFPRLVPSSAAMPQAGLPPQAKLRDEVVV